MTSCLETVGCSDAQPNMPLLRSWPQHHNGRSLLCTVLLSLLFLALLWFPPLWRFWSLLSTLHTLLVSHGFFCAAPLLWGGFLSALSGENWTGAGGHTGTVCVREPSLCYWITELGGLFEVYWSGVWHTWVQILFLLLTKFVSLIKAFNFSSPVSPRL